MEINSDNSNKGLVMFTITLNALIGLGDRVLQIIYFINKDLYYSELNKIGLTFIILPTAIHFFLFLMYVIFHNEPMLTIGVKAKNFLFYFLSSQLYFPLGIQRALKNRLSEVADYGIVILRVLNGIHVICVSLPQLLIVILFPLSKNEKLKILEIISICFSGVFILWSIIYYFICESEDEDFDIIIYELGEKL